MNDIEAEFNNNILAFLLPNLLFSSLSPKGKLNISINYQACDYCGHYPTAHRVVVRDPTSGELAPPPEKKRSRKRKMLKITEKVLFAGAGENRTPFPLLPFYLIRVY